MIKKTITYKDYDGNEYTEDFFFHLTKGDLIDWAAEEEDLEAIMKKIIKEDDPIKIIPMVKEIITRSYGKKVGKGFVKTKEVLDEFIYTEAFSELYMELSSDADALAEFSQGIMPEFDEKTQKAIDDARKKFLDEHKIEE